MSVRLDYVLSLATTEVLDLQVDDASNPSILHDNFVQRGTWDATSTPPLSLQYTDTITFGGGNGGTATMDLTSFLGTGGGSRNGNGLKVYAFQVNNLSTFGTVKVRDHASNPYYILGASGDSITIGPGGTAIFLEPDGFGTIVDLSSHNVEFWGQSGESCQVKVLMGT